MDIGKFTIIMVIYGIKGISVMVSQLVIGKNIMLMGI
jgi:hypothetical protein